ncbi:TonB-dependent siderophore receptor [Methylosinus sp. PW1]|uniref:TonB-dependent siderophore receptor n=1 Tax=Methylosinus sp. PW1 TaxID=107636 RepID=UPI00056D5F88|nr:TonB-dependent siderophore receptor [Methylosinus sp. PW1]
MIRSHLLRGASACAIAFAFALPARGQESLPAIDIAGQTLGGSGSGKAGAADKSARSGGRETGYNQVGPAASTKTSIPILETPYSVQIVPRETMDDRQAVSIRDALFTNVSGVAGSSNYYDGVIVRGFDSGNQIYRNGLRQPNATNQETTNLQSIEVLKGPAAMLYGRVEPGGLINIVTKRPQETPYFSVHQQVGSFGLTRTAIDATGPLLEDKTLLYRMNVSYLAKDSFQPHVGQDNLLISPSITWRPTEQFTLNVEGEYQRGYFRDLSPIPALGFRPAGIPISRYLLDSYVADKYPNFQERSLFGYDWTYRIDNDWSVTNRLSHTRADYRQRGHWLDSFSNEATGDALRGIWLVPTPNAAEPIFYRETVSTNVDLQGKAVTGPLTHRVLAGFDYYSHDLKAHGHCCDYISSINIYYPVNIPANVDALSSSYRTINKEKWKGLYAQDQISFWDDRIQLLLGGRHDWAESSTATLWSDESFAEVDSRRVVVPVSANSPRIGVLIRPFSWLSVYGNYTRSYGSSNGIDQYSRPLQPQIGTQFEGGVKAELLDGRLTATAAYFDIDKKNQTTAISGTPFVRVIDGRSNGVELDLTGRIDEHWSVIANFTHLDARIVKDHDVVNGGGTAGKRLHSVPHNTANLWAKYEAWGALAGLTVGGGVSYVDKAFGDNDNSFELPAHARVDVMASYKLEAGWIPHAPKLTFQLNVNNLLDTTYYEGGGGRMGAVPGAPRTFLGSLRAEF